MKIPKVKTPKVDVNKIIQLSNQIYNKVNIDTITKELKDTSEYAGIKKDLSNLAKSTKKDLEEAIEESGIEDTSKNLNKKERETMAEQQARFRKEIEDKEAAAERVINGISPKSISDLLTDTTTESIFSDIEKVNPFYGISTDGAFTENCSYAAIAYELRRRGYDVIADAFFGIKDEARTTPLWNYQNWYSDSAISKFFSSGKFVNAKEFNIKDENDVENAVNSFISDVKSQGEGARGMINVYWAYDASSGHAINYEVYNNEILLIDSQSGTIYKDEETIKNYINSTKYFMYFRTDNLEVKESALEGVINREDIDYIHEYIHLMTKDTYETIKGMWK